MYGAISFHWGRELLYDPSFLVEDVAKAKPVYILLAVSNKGPCLWLGLMWTIV